MVSQLSRLAAAGLSVRLPELQGMANSILSQAHHSSTPTPTVSVRWPERFRKRHPELMARVLKPSRGGTRTGAKPAVPAAVMTRPPRQRQQQPPPPPQRQLTPETEIIQRWSTPYTVRHLDIMATHMLQQPMKPEVRRLLEPCLKSCVVLARAAVEAVEQLRLQTVED